MRDSSWKTIILKQEWNIWCFQRSCLIIKTLHRKDYQLQTNYGPITKYIISNPPDEFRQMGFKSIPRGKLPFEKYTVGGIYGRNDNTHGEIWLLGLVQV